ncbi:hypothetical protein D8674_004747 [Pyrus ussuriensis x Pyrus communis]|uniref:Reverse transcriptase Ty1/copia-type domain-containing protein n=1 Tax=Pyrus ussuriensis x Pyrus communis TaxID=2448454 RepID=A0A5N5FUF0_9ROSA|nr:hypothetical protein D8674_004747 [Pyrus ussuriensis x Pyrus communis]
MAMNMVKVESLLGMLTIRLQEDNFVKWSFQFRSVLEGNDLFDHFDGTSVCPPKFVFTEDGGITTEVTAAYKEWIKRDRALVSLLLATLGDEAVEYVVGSRTAHEAWMNLQDQFATVSRARVNHLKTELLTIKKGSDSVEKYMLRIKVLKDQLLAAGEVVSENDLIVAALAGLPAEFNMIRTVIVARETPISLKEFRAQLLAAERTAEDSHSTMTFPMSGMYCHGESSNANSSQSQSSAQQFSGGYGFVSGANAHSQHNPQRSTGEFVSQANLPQFHQQNNANFQNHRGYQNYGGNNGRGNNRPRYNGTNNGRFSGNSNFFAGSTNNNGSSNFGSKGGSTWQQWNGNNGSKPTLIPECQICHKRVPVLLLQLWHVKFVERKAILLSTVITEAIMHTKSSIPFEKVHTDVWGPSPTVSVEGYRYYVIFVDECTRHVIHNEHVFPFKTSQSIHSPQSVSTSPTQRELPRVVSSSGTASDSGLLPLQATTLLPTPSSPRLPVHNPSQIQVPSHSADLSQNACSTSANMVDISSVSPNVVAGTSSVFVHDVNDPAIHNDVLDVPSEHHMITRLKSGALQRKDYSGYCASVSMTPGSSLSSGDDIMFRGFTAILDIHESSEPTHYKQAVSSVHWRNAMQEEFEALQKQGTWELVPVPQNRNVIGSKWVYKLKKDQDGKVSRYKARLVAQGFSQEHGLDYEETFSPVVRHTTVRLVLSLAAMNKWDLRPDIAYAVNYACQFMTTPTEEHFCLIKRILRYLKGTLQCGLTYSAQGKMELLAYSDADWAADINTRRSTTGYIVFMGSNPVSWQSKKQGSVSRSSTEAEYKALANAAADVAWVRSVLRDLHVFLPSAPLLHCDNLSTLALCSNPVFHTRIKHLDTDFHFVRERVQKGDLEVQYIPTEAQVADVLTKGLHSPVFIHHCTNLRLGYPS